MLLHSSHNTKEKKKNVAKIFLKTIGYSVNELKLMILRCLTVLSKRQNKFLSQFSKNLQTDFSSGNNLNNQSETSFTFGDNFADTLVCIFNSIPVIAIIVFKQI